MVEHRIRSIIVLDGAQKLVGIVAREDVIKALKATARRLIAAAPQVAMNSAP